MRLYLITAKYYLKNIGCYIDTNDSTYISKDWLRFGTVQNLDNKHWFLFRYNGYSKQETTYDTYLFKQKIIWRDRTHTIHLIVKTVPTLNPTVQGYETEGVAYLVYKIQENNPALEEYCNFTDFCNSEGWYSLREKVKYKIDYIRDLREDDINAESPNTSYYGPYASRVLIADTPTRTTTEDLVPLLEREHLPSVYSGRHPLPEISTFETVPEGDILSNERALLVRVQGPAPPSDPFLHLSIGEESEIDNYSVGVFDNPEYQTSEGDTETEDTQGTDSDVSFTQEWFEVVGPTPGAVRIFERLTGDIRRELRVLAIRAQEEEEETEEPEELAF